MLQILGFNAAAIVPDRQAKGLPMIFPTGGERHIDSSAATAHGLSGIGNKIQ